MAIKKEHKGVERVKLQAQQSKCQRIVAQLTEGRMGMTKRTEKKGRVYA